MKRGYGPEIANEKKKENKPGWVKLVDVYGIHANGQ